MGITESHARCVNIEQPIFDLSKCAICCVKLRSDSKWYFYNDQVHCSSHCRNISMSYQNSIG